MRFTPPSSLLSPDVYRLIDSSRRLREALAPDGLFASPYEVLDYDGLLLLQDHKGRKATFKRRQRVRFLQNGVRSVMEHLWATDCSLNTTTMPGTSRTRSATASTAISSST